MILVTPQHDGTFVLKDTESELNRSITDIGILCDTAKFVAQKRNLDVVYVECPDVCLIGFRRDTFRPLQPGEPPTVIPDELFVRAFDRHEQKANSF